MTAPVPADPRQARAASPAGRDAQARELAEFLARQDAVDASAAHWLVRRQDGLSAPETAEFDAWLAADTAHRAALERLSAVWDRLDGLPARAVDGWKASLGPAPGARRQDGACATPGPAAGRRNWLAGVGRLAPQFAAAGLAVALVGAGWLGWDHWQQQPTFSTRMATVRGQQSVVRLPDGSSVQLDTATRAEVRLYRQRREVRLAEGQAMFSVAARADQPFDVLAGPLRIRVIGTRFSVRHTGSGPGRGVRVEVEQGRVRVSAVEPGGRAGAAAELGAGQAVVAGADGQLGAVVRRPVDAVAPWREGRVNFDDTPLGEALAEFERYADTGLVLQDPDLAALRLSGSFDLRRFSAFAQALPQVLPVRLRTRADGVTEVLRAH